MLKAYPNLTHRIEMPVAGMAAGATVTAPTLYVNGVATAITVTADASTAGRLVLTHTTNGRTLGDLLTYDSGATKTGFVTVNGSALPIVVDPHIIDVLSHTRLAPATPGRALLVNADGSGQADVRQVNGNVTHAATLAGLLSDYEQDGELPANVFRVKRSDGSSIAADSYFKNTDDPLPASGDWHKADQAQEDFTNLLAALQQVPGLTRVEFNTDESSTGLIRRLIAVQSAAATTLARLLPGLLGPAGLTLYNRRSWTDLSDFVVYGQAPTIVDGKIRFNPSSVGDTVSYLELPSTVSNAQNYDVVVTIQASGPSYAPGATEGFGVGRHSQHPQGQNSSYAKLLTSVSPPALLLYGGVNEYRGGANSDADFVVSPGDVLELTHRFRGAVTSFIVRNLTTGRIATYVHVEQFTLGASVIPNTSRVRVYGAGGQFDVLSIEVRLAEPFAPRLAVFGDSRAGGYSAGLSADRMVELIEAKWGRVGVYCGGGDRTTEVLAATDNALLTLPDTVLYAGVGRNDIKDGVPSATWQANHAASVAKARVKGCRIGHCENPPEVNGIDPTAYNAWLHATYPDDVIVPVPPGYDPAVHTVDGVHWNKAGQALWAVAIMASGLFGREVDAPASGQYLPRLLATTLNTDATPGSLAVNVAAAKALATSTNAKALLIGTNAGDSPRVVTAAADTAVAKSRADIAATLVSGIASGATVVRADDRNGEQIAGDQGGDGPAPNISVSGDRVQGGQP